MSSFKHSGDAGDVVYSLCAVKALGGGTLYLADEKGVRVPFTPAHRANVTPLLERQAYVKRVLVHDGRDVRYNLDLFRKGFNEQVHIGHLHLRAFGLDDSLTDQPWLEADVNPVAEVVINLTPRYRNRYFPWPALYAKYGQRAVFVGSQREHADFVDTYGPLPWAETKDYAALAAVINGAKLFIGNQSSPLAIAAGLGKNIICEINQSTPNTILKRPNFHCSGGGIVQMPEI